MLNAIFVLFAIFFTLKAIKAFHLRSKLPPGPSGVPIFGNVFQLPQNQMWLAFDKWTKQYGPIFYLNIAGQDVIVLGHRKAATDLLDRRANAYSDRPELVVSNLFAGGMHWALAQADGFWKKQRRRAYEALNGQTAKEYFPYQETESVILVDQLLTNPENFLEHFWRVSTSLNLSIIYGWSPVLDSNHPTILQLDIFNRRILEAAVPNGSFWVEFKYFNWMKYLPAWMCSWRRYAEKKFAHDSIMLEGLSADVRKRMEAGDDSVCVAGKILESTESPFEAAWNSATIYSAGSETTSTQLAWFMQAVILYPEAQRRAHEELDRVVGSFRLPSFDDYEHLPYIRAMVKEILRWRPAGPFGEFRIPHRLNQDDYYEGYFLPKGTICFPNLWSIHHDTELYGDDAEHFNPSRFLNVDGIIESSIEDTKDEGHFGFGFGKSLFIHIAYMLWAFNITAEIDSNGTTKLPDPLQVIEGLTTPPMPFGCKITPRNADVVGLIAQAKIERLGVQADPRASSLSQKDQRAL
ncbi:cytochrome P450 [Lentinula raphanica]|uniref:Cytochrome P450 n=1 Tax=Lentinula raphanica TaxID=153919 RepID=A0AA38P3A1_9AGAR|nr:cytochrome P450 [Lentinula raphanica]